MTEPTGPYGNPVSQSGAGGLALPSFSLPPAPGQGSVGPTFGGSQDVDPNTGRPYPRVGIGRTTETWWQRRPAGGLLARDMQGLGDTPTERTRQQFQTAPAPDLLNDLLDMPKPELRALQLKMYDAGFYGNVSKDAIVFGVADDSTFDAFQGLLQLNADYVGAGREVAWFETLDEVQRLRKEQGTNLLDNQGPKRAPFRAEVTAGADIESVATHVAQQLTGQAPDPALIRQIIANYQGAQTSAQRQAYNTVETGGTVEAAPNVEVFAENAIESADPVGTAAYRGADSVMSSLFRVLEGPLEG